eukprot:scaffold42585_cov69-Phaeocystis_antarctica.AAC.1
MHPGAVDAARSRCSASGIAGAEPQPGQHPGVRVDRSASLAASEWGCGERQPRNAAHLELPECRHEQLHKERGCRAHKQ